MQDKTKTDRGIDLVLFIIVILFLIKFCARFMIWFNEPRNMWLSLTALGLIGTGAGIALYFKLKKIRDKNLHDKSVTDKTNDSVFCGTTDKNEDVWIKPDQRAMHTQVIGTTNAGKTESVILPSAFRIFMRVKDFYLLTGRPIIHCLINSGPTRYTPKEKTILNSLALAVLMNRFSSIL